MWQSEAARGSRCRFSPSRSDIRARRRKYTARCGPHGRACGQCRTSAVKTYRRAQTFGRGCHERERSAGALRGWAPRVSRRCGPTPALAPHCAVTAARRRGRDRDCGGLARARAFERAHTCQTAAVALSRSARRATCGLRRAACGVRPAGRAALFRHRGRIFARDGENTPRDAARRDAARRAMSRAAVPGERAHRRPHEERGEQSTPGTAGTVESLPLCSGRRGRATRARGASGRARRERARRSRDASGRDAGPRARPARPVRSTPASR